MLKQHLSLIDLHILIAATFGWLCVETIEIPTAHKVFNRQPPSGGCVLKLNNYMRFFRLYAQPPSGGCVLKLILGKFDTVKASSHLRVAVC